MNAHYVAHGRGASVGEMLEALETAQQRCLAAPDVAGKTEWLERAEKARRHLSRLELVAGSGARTDVAFAFGGITGEDLTCMALAQTPLRQTREEHEAYIAVDHAADLDCGMSEDDATSSDVFERRVLGLDE